MGKWFAKDGGDEGEVCQVRITLSNAAWTLAVAGSIITGNGTPAQSRPAVRFLECELHYTQ